MNDVTAASAAQGLISAEVAPFGGARSWGFGREGPTYGIEDDVEIKCLCLGRIVAP